MDEHPPDRERGTSLLLSSAPAGCDLNGEVQRNAHVTFQCASIVPGQSAGIEGVVYGLLPAVSEHLTHGSVDVLIPSGTYQGWSSAVPRRENIRFREVISTASVGPFSAGRGRAFKKKLARSPTVRYAIGRFRGWVEARAVSPETGIVYYPYHRTSIAAELSAVTVHDLRVLQPHLSDNLEEQQLRGNVAKAAVVIVSWKHPYDQLIEAIPEAVAKTCVIPLPVLQPPRVSQQPDRNRPFTWIYAASTAPHKNHAALLSALAALDEDDVQLICPGPAIEPIYTDLRTQVHRLGLNERVKFTGFVSVEELDRLYSVADAVIAPTLWEAASGTVFEAFARGLPVACSAIPPLTSQVASAEGDAAFFDPRDVQSIASAMQRVMRGRGQLADSAARAGRNVLGVTWELTARRYLNAFKWASERSGSNGWNA